jgi:hypothetical protein
VNWPTVNILSFLKYYHILAHLECIHRGLKTAAFAPYNSADLCLAKVGRCHLRTFATCDSDHLAAPHILVYIISVDFLTTVFSSEHGKKCHHTLPLHFDSDGDK